MTAVDDAKLELGDEVRVFDVNGKRYGQPDDGVRATVVKVGRRLVTLDIANGYGTGVFRLETGAENDVWGHRWFRTVEQAEMEIRRTAAVARMKEHGIEVLRSLAGVSLDQLEAIVAILEPEPAVRDQERAQ